MTLPTWTWASTADVSERLEWLTDVLPAATGPEQRRRLRIAPRIRQTFDSLASESARRQMETALVAHGSDTWQVPLAQDASQVLGQAGSVLSADARFRRFRVGGSVLVMRDDPRTFDVGVVTALTDSTITLLDAPAYAWGPGAWVMPLVEARLDAAPQLARFTGDTHLARVEFRITEPLDWAEDAGPYTYRDLPVLELRVDWSRDPETTHDRAVMELDNDTGLPAHFDLPGMPMTVHVFQATLDGHEAVAAYRSLAYALAGRWGVLWVPSQAQDFLVVADLVAASATLDVEWTGISTRPVHFSRRDLRIELDSGAVLYRRILGAAPIGDHERLTLDAPLGVTTTADRVRIVSFLTLARQDTDVNLLKHWKADLAQTELRFRGISADDI